MRASEAGDLDRARYLLDLNRPADALKLVEAAIAAEPESVDALLLISRAHRSLGAADLAYEATARATRLDPNDPRVHRHHTMTAVTLGRLDEAVHHARMGVRLDPLNDRAYLALAHALSSVAKPSPMYAQAMAEARDAAHRAVELSPEDPATLSLAGWSAMRAGDTAFSEEVSRRAVEIDPNSSRALATLGVLQTAKGKGVSAADHFTAALGADPLIADPDMAFAAAAGPLMRKTRLLLRLAALIMLPAVMSGFPGGSTGLWPVRLIVLGVIVALGTLLAVRTLRRMRPTTRDYLFRRALWRSKLAVPTGLVLLSAAGIAGSGLLPWAEPATISLLTGLASVVLAGLMAL